MGTPARLGSAVVGSIFEGLSAKIVHQKLEAPSLCFGEGSNLAALEYSIGEKESKQHCHQTGNRIFRDQVVAILLHQWIS